MSSLVVILTELVVKESELITGIEEEVEWIERELRLMETVLESVRARDEQDPCAIEWEKETEEVARRAEDLIATYTKRFQKQCTIDLRRKHRLAIKLKELMTKIYSVSEKGKKIIIGNSADKDQDGQITVETETRRSNNTVSSAMEQLNTVLSQKWLLDARDLKVVKSVRDELTPLQDLLDEMEGLEDQQLYQVWVHQIEGVFQLVYDTFASRVHDGVKQGNGFGSLIAPLYSLYNVPRLDQKILKIRKQISEIWRRYHTYEIGEFRGRETWRRVVVPKPISPDIYTSVSGVSSTKDITEWLKVEMELMKYFIEHGQIREDLDERNKVWFRQMEEIYPDLEAKAVFAQGIIEEMDYLFNPLSLISFENRVKKIQKQIYYVSNMKIAYDISSNMQQAASIVIPQPPPLDILPGDDEEHTLRESNPRRRQW